LLFIAELNHLQMWATDVGNAYLEAKTTEKVYVIAESEFGDLEGHVLIIIKALYGLRTSVFVGMKNLLTVFAKWISFSQKQKQTFGCENVLTSMNTLVCM
jgi:hypothetical protein